MTETKRFLPAQVNAIPTPLTAARLLAAVVILFSATTALAAPSAPATPPASPTAADAAPSTAAKANSRSALNERQVPFEELKNRIGQRVIIRTIHHTTRSGALSAYDIASIDIVTDKDQGGFTLTVPRNTIQSVSIILEQIKDDPLFPTAGKPGAKKN